MKREALRFGLHLIPSFLVFLFLYPTILPFYERVVVAIANEFLGVLSPPLRTVVDEQGRWVVHEKTPDGALRALYGVSRSSRHLIYSSLIVVPSLLLATPVPTLRKRFSLLGWGVALLLPVHVLSEVGLARSYVCLDLEPDRFLCAWIRVSLETGGQLFSVVLWALLTWRYWLPARPPASPSAP